MPLHCWRRTHAKGHGVTLHIEAQGATPQPLSSARHRRAQHYPHGSPRDSTMNPGPVQRFSVSSCPSL